MMKHNVNKKCNSNYFLLERQSLLIFNKYKLKEGEITENAVFDLFYSNHKFSNCYKIPKVFLFKSWANFDKELDYLSSNKTLTLTYFFYSC